MLGRISRILFFLIVFSLSFQVGLHFWPKFAYVGGVRVDYLSPTLYFLDILILLYILTSLPAFLKKKVRFPKNNLLKVLIALISISLILGVFISKSPQAHIFGVIKLIELSLFAFCVAKTFVKKDIPLFVYTLCLSAVFSSGLAIWQFVNQSSIGGVFYFIGERTFSLSTIGVSSVNLNQQILRPYAAFPHPNVLAFFILMAIIFITGQIFVIKQNLKRILLITAIVFLQITILLTFSRSTIFLSILFFSYIIYKNTGRSIRYILTIGFYALVLSTIFILPSSLLLRGIDFRQELFSQSFTILSSSPLLGVGLNNFFINQFPLIKNVSPTNFQPVHNIYFLWFLQVGVLGFLIFPYLFYLSIQSVVLKLKAKSLEQKTFSRSILFCLLAIIFIGLLDHFFLTVEQGQIMLALIFGLSFAKML